METTWVEPWSLDEGAARATELFRVVFGGDPTGVWQAPGRVNVIGEHVDYNGGLCLPIALPHRVHVAVRPRADRIARLVSDLEPGDVREIDLDAVGPVGTSGEVEGWIAYPLGVAWALEQHGYGALPGFDVAFSSTVPLGAGLSSSAAVECAMAVALDELAGLCLIGGDAARDDAGRARLVEICRSAENEVAGANTGGLDQSASLRCRRGHALELDCRDMSATQVPLDLAGAGLELLVIDTKAPHRLVDGQYAARRATCEAAARLLGVDLLVEVDPEGLDAALDRLPDPEMRRRVRHIVTEIARTREFVALLRSGLLVGDRLGHASRLMNASHESLRGDYEVSSPELDAAVDAARSAGAHGARMTGGGFGGSAIALVDAGDKEAIASAIAESFARNGFRAPAFLSVLPKDPAGRIL